MVANPPKSDPRPRHTSRGIVLSDNKILLMERWRKDMHYFSIPGGGIETGESPEQTVVREIFEETSVKVKPVRLVIVMLDGDVRHEIYLCKYIKGEPYLDPRSPEFIQATDDNKFKPRWVAVKDIPNLPFMYWQPVKNVLIEEARRGFSSNVITVESDSKNK